jgi:ATP adenylyltransferase
MEYIAGPGETGCLFCRVRQADPSADRANLLVWRGERVIVVMNKFPYNSGHVMVAPVEHVGSPVDLSDGDALALQKGVSMSLRAISDVMSPEGYNIGANLGRVAGAGIPDHVHYHVVPRWGGDTNFMPVLGETKVVNEHLERTWEKLTAAFSKIAAA